MRLAGTALFLTIVFCSLAAPVKADLLRAQINIRPGSDRNVIKASSDGLIPAVILGSSVVDVTTINPYSLELKLSSDLIASSGINPSTFRSSRVSTGRDRKLRCSIEDVGSYDSTAFDSLGGLDGRNDLVCQFTGDVTLILGVRQELYLTGYLDDGTMVFGGDFAIEPTPLNATVVCCIVCTGPEGNQSCSGCNQIITACTDELKSCSSGSLSEWSGCEAPRIARSWLPPDQFLACALTGFEQPSSTSDLESVLRLRSLASWIR
jgi:hypothetical protein